VAVDDDAYIEAQHRWASKKFDIPIGHIKSVEFFYSRGYSFSEYTYDNGTFDVTVRLTDGDYRVFDDLDPTKIIVECMREM